MESLSILSLAGVVLFYQDSAVIMAINLSKYTGGVAHIQNDAIITWLFQTVGTCAIPMTHGYGHGNRKCMTSGTLAQRLHISDIVAALYENLNHTSFT